MDPNANIKRQLELAAEINKARDGDDEDYMFDVSAFELAELVESLDAWRKQGGFDPYAYVYTVLSYYEGDVLGSNSGSPVAFGPYYGIVAAEEAARDIAHDNGTTTEVVSLEHDGDK